MSSKLTTSRFGSFFGIGNKHSTKRAAAQKESVGGFRDARQNTPPSDYRALHGGLYLDDAGGGGFPTRNAPTVPESQQPNSQKRHYRQSLYTLPDTDPFAATPPIALPTSPNPRPPSYYSTLPSPPKNCPILIRAQSDTSVPVPSPFGSPIDHGQNDSG